MALREEELTSLCDDVDLERDRALVERCQAGDAAAFGNLYARYYERLLRFCLRRLNDRHEAEDAAQEAFARAWKALPRFAGERRFYPWLTVIAGNICTDMLRRRSRSTPTDDMELTAQQPVGVAVRTPPRSLSWRPSTESWSTVRWAASRRATATCLPCARDLDGPTSRSRTTKAWRSGPSRRCSGVPARRSSASSRSCPNRRRPGRLPHRHRRAHPPQCLPSGAPRCQRAAQGGGAGDDAKRRGRRCRDRRGGRGCLHRPARARRAARARPRRRPVRSSRAASCAGVDALRHGGATSAGAGTPTGRWLDCRVEYRIERASASGGPRAVSGAGGSGTSNRGAASTAGGAGSLPARSPVARRRAPVVLRRGSARPRRA